MTNYVLAETLTLIREKLGFDTAQALFRRYSELSFVDATIAAYMSREHVEYLYSFDSDFDAVDGVTRLAGPSNPLR